MTNKEFNRTTNKLWLFNYYCTVIIVIALHLSFIVATETENAIVQNVTALENNSTSQKPVAEALIRFRRQPPRTIVKHIIRPKRYKVKRIKRPKIKYNFAEPPPTYYSRKPFIKKKPTFDSAILENFSHINVESTDFDLPPSSYESQSMDLDLYNHYEPSIEAASYKEIQKPSYYTYAEPEFSYKESPSYTYSAPKISYKESNAPTGSYSYTASKPRKPHTKYGVPSDFVYNSGYDEHNDNKYSFETPASETAYTEVKKPFYNEHAKNVYTKEVPRIPATKYGVPDVQIPVTGSNDYNKYSVVEQQPPYSNHAPTKAKTYHFAEPPQPESSVEITYSPSYEINIPAPHENSYFRGKYNVNNHESILHSQPSQHLPPRYEEPSYQQHPNYEEIPEQQHPAASYQHTDNYESQPQEHYENIGPSHQDVSGTIQPANYQPAPSKHQGIDAYIPASQDLPINVNHKQRPYNYPKSSYEVPIYDPIPFDASTHQEREIYPPQTIDESSKVQPPNNRNYQTPPHRPSLQEPPFEDATPNDVHSSNNPNENIVKRPQSPINHLRRTRKRKRNKGSTTTVSTTKHILDVPELEEAFAKENRHKYTNSQEPDVDESQTFENINNNKRNNINDNNNYSKGSWNPIKIRTSPIILMTTPSTIPSIKILDTKNKRYHYKQQRIHKTTTTTTTTTTKSPVNVEILSIDKSKSKTYYDGVISTPRIYNTNLFRNRFRLEKTTTSTSTTPPPHIKSKGETNFSKRTTKNIFDTTVFKSPLNDRDILRNLPKNHKLF